MKSKLLTACTALLLALAMLCACAAPAAQADPAPEAVADPTAAPAVEAEPAPEAAPAPEAEPAPAPEAESDALQADVVVIGAGGAGVAAALSAAEQGAKVVVVEKSGIMGGNTMVSGGAMNAAIQEHVMDLPMTDTMIAEIKALCAEEPKNETQAAWQAAVAADIAAYEAAGSTYLYDSPYLHMLQSYKSGKYIADPVLVELMCSEAPNTVAWLSDMGMVFDGVSLGAGALWQRMQYGSAYIGGQGYFAVMGDYIEAQGLDVTFLYSTPAKELLTENGRVSGVVCTDADGKEVTVLAGKGVILATGGFAANVEMRVKYNELWPDLGEGTPTSNRAEMTGDGIVMATAVGAALVDMKEIQLLPICDPETGYEGNIVGDTVTLSVNSEGKRFVNEMAGRDELSMAALNQPGGIYYMISCGRNVYTNNGVNYKGHTEDEMIAAGGLCRVDTIEELAAWIGCDAATLQATIDAHNANCADGTDEEFGRPIYAENYLVDTPPYYACRRAPAVHHTMGGVVVNTQQQVLNEQGGVIAGLFAAGEVTGGFHGANRVGGNAVSEALTTGRLAGASAMK